MQGTTHFTTSRPLDAFANVKQPTGAAQGLPNRCYTDPAFQAEEMESLFARTWACIGTAASLPRNGYARPVDFLGVPLLMVRDHGGAVRVYHNVCSHRGVKLVTEPQRVKGRLRCPYHSFCYELNSGALCATPHFGGHNIDRVDGFDPARHGLRPVRTAVWADLVFVNLAGNAPAFEDHVAPLARRWSAYDLGLIRHGGDIGASMDFDVRTNWKLAVENYCESYHLPWVHPGLNSYSKLGDHYTIIGGDLYAGQGVSNYAPADDAPLPKFPGLDAAQEKGAEYVALFPNVLLGIQSDHFFSIWLEPLGVERTVEHLNIYYVGEEAVSEAYADSRRKTLERWKEVFVEDVDVVQRMQQGRASPAFDGGLFSPVMDTGNHAFHLWVARALTEGILDGPPDVEIVAAE
ncbi:aromatic ring-hydroxylating oxygenase subunit alpha [Ferruginivarius sediminum]|uniref:Aromatic ring-hydroxylating dioxygenase subunit alpha n=1 Tax=Ferruginivarius sediminum TaxID=2661937 RepID=A0A369TBI4_9PROT|nr:aromatic ring-hydroxylating dioxygenase subunit alpha [Ferruginivarius sediminum]RDD62212.1 aromatic ring-hydroxylating dioxygenase subunit alpha [Ferruginivarius sediminum]